jgi:thiol:disulfide interchange protein DsbA
MHFAPFFRVFSLRILLAIALSVAGLTANADIHPGKEYELVSPSQPVETGNSIEVLELFFYPCPHCFNLDPELNKWVKQLPKDVTFRRLPAIFNPAVIPFAKTFYTFEAMGLTERLHSEFFNAYHVKHNHFSDDNAIFDWVEKQGVPKKSFIDIYSSFSIQSKALRAQQLTKAYGISGVPTIVVDGKYRTSVDSTGSHAGLLSALDLLIKQARRERGGK